MHHHLADLVNVHAHDPPLRVARLVFARRRIVALRVARRRGHHRRPFAAANHREDDLMTGLKGLEMSGVRARVTMAATDPRTNAVSMHTSVLVPPPTILTIIGNLGETIGSAAAITPGHAKTSEAIGTTIATAASHGVTLCSHCAWSYPPSETHPHDHSLPFRFKCAKDPGQAPWPGVRVRNQRRYRSASSMGAATLMRTTLL